MRRTVTKFWLENSTSMYYIYIGLINLLSVLKGRLLMVDVTDQISHEHEKKNFFTRWFMSTNHKDIGILYIFTAALLGFVAVAFTVYMRLEPHGARRSIYDKCRWRAKWAYVECFNYRTRSSYDVFCRYPSAFRWFWQLFHALNDRCTGHGISKDE